MASAMAHQRAASTGRRAAPPPRPAARGAAAAALPPRRRRRRRAPPPPPRAEGGPPAERNPQNVDAPRVLPSPALSAEACVAAQLDALRAPDEPWPGHGVQVAYEFGADLGGLDPSWYFGFPKDLYHQDHFMGMFQTKLGHLVGLREYRLLGAGSPHPESEAVVRAEVVAGAGAAAGRAARFDFHLTRKAVGPRKGALVTRMVVPAEG